MCIAEIIATKKYGDPIEIEWDDAWSNHDWHVYDSAMVVPDEVFSKTRAWFVGETKHFIHVVHTIGRTKENEMTGLLLIPKGTIKKVK